MFFRCVFVMLSLVWFFISGPVLAHPHHLNVDHQANSATDFNGNGSVDFPDFLLFASAFGKTASSGNAKFDLDASGSVDFGDFLLFASAFGHAVSSTGETGTGGTTNGTGSTGSGSSGNVTTITTSGSERVIKSNAIPDHETGTFPNSGNPHSITSQSLEFRVALNPAQANATTSLLGTDHRPAYKFGVATNGIPYDPTTAEFWKNDATTGWNIEAKGTQNLGLDQNDAHVQPDGTYHYHGVPWGLFAKQDTTRHSALYGYAADGYPIYIFYGYSNGSSVSSLKRLKSSYKLKSGTRSSSGPGGSYDGTYTQDYDYIAGSGDLDACNGRTGITPEYPSGTYYYVLTDSFPYQPRCFKGTPNATFKLGGAGGGTSTGSGGTTGTGGLPPSGGGQGPPGLPPPGGGPRGLLPR